MPTPKKKSPTINPKFIREVIADVLKTNYLGSSNLQETNQTGDLNGFYINLARNKLLKYQKEHEGKDITEYGLLYSAAIVDEIGVGNCGELTDLTIVRLLSSEVYFSNKLQKY